MSCRCAFVVAVCVTDLQLIALVVVAATAAFSWTSSSSDSGGGGGGDDAASVALDGGIKSYG